MKESILNRLANGWIRRLKSRPVVVRWNPRMRSLAGTANFSTREVELNERLLRRRRREAVSTLAHEVCHLVVGDRAGHGPRWAEAMKALGFSPETTHTLDVTHLMQKRRVWTWSCAKCRRSVARTHTGADRFRCPCGGRFEVGPLSDRPPRAARRSVPEPTGNETRLAASRPRRTARRSSPSPR